MNRTINQLVNALHLDPKREAAVRKIIENAGGINDSTPIVNEVSGNELIPINVDGENKAVSAAALVKGAKEVLYVDITNIQEEGSFIMSYDDYKNHIVYFTITEGRVVHTAEKVLSRGIDYYGSVNYIDTYLFKNDGGVGPDTTKPVKTMAFAVAVDVNNNQVISISRIQVNQIFPYTIGNGTKFLSDDGTYKEVSGGSEPYVIDSNSNPSEVFNYLKTNNNINFTNIMVGFDVYQTYYAGKVFNIAEYENYVILEALGYVSNYGGSYDGIIFAIKVTEDEISLNADKEGNAIYSNVLSNIVIASIDANNTFNAIYNGDWLWVGSYNILEINKETTFIFKGYRDDNGVDFSGFTNGIYGYQGEFSFGDTVYTVTFPEGVKWSTDSVLEYKPNHTYQFRILNNLGVMKEFANA